MFGEIEVIPTAGATVTFAAAEAAQPAEVVTRTLSVSVPLDPAVKVIAFVPVPPVIVPFVMLQL